MIRYTIAILAILNLAGHTHEGTSLSEQERPCCAKEKFECGKDARGNDVCISVGCKETGVQVRIKYQCRDCGQAYYSEWSSCG